MNNNYKWETVGKCKFYTDGTTCTDIEVMDDAKEISFIYPKIIISRERCQKVFSNIETLLIGRNVISIVIPNKMFPNVKRVQSKSSNFLDGKYLIERAGRKLLNAFGQSEDAEIDFTRFRRIGNYAFEGCKAKVAAGIYEMRILAIQDAAFVGSGFLDKPFIGGIKCLGPFIIDIDETADEIILPKSDVYFCVPKIQKKCVRVPNINVFAAMRKSPKKVIIEDENIRYDDDLMYKLSNRYIEELESRVSRYKTVDGILYSADMKTLILCPAGKTGEVTIPDGVERIRKQAFFGSKISKVVFPDSLVRLQNEAFYGCENLKEIDFGNGIEQIGGAENKHIFSGCPVEKLIFPPQVKEIGRCVNVHIDNRNGIFDFVLPCSVSVIVGARTNIIINQMADCKYAKKLSGLRYLETAYMNASNSMYKYAVAYKTYKKAKNKCTKEFLLDNQKHVAKAIILEMEEKDFADFVKFDFINLKYDEDIVKCLEERNWTAALAYMLKEGKGRPEDALVI